MRLLLGVGNPDRGDDGVGPEVAARIARLGLPGVQVVVEAQPLALLDHLRGPPRPGTVVVVDALAPGHEPGRVRVLEVGEHRLLPRWRCVGSHGLGVAHAVEMARALDLMPPRLTLVGVEAGSAGLGATLSAPVVARLDDVVCTVSEILGQHTTPGHEPSDPTTYR